MNVATEIRPGNAAVDEYAHREAVLKALRRRFHNFDQDELEDLCQESWAKMLAAQQAGTRLDDVEAYLIQTAANLGLKKIRARTTQRTEAVDPLGEILSGVQATQASPAEELETTVEAALCREIIDSLSGREREVAKLRLDWQLDADEICTVLGISQRTYRRLIERAGNAIAERVEEVADGRWSNRQRRLLVMCSVGLASPAQRAQAARLLRDDPSCRALARSLRETGAAVGATLPVPSAELVGEHPLGRIAEMAGAAKGQLVDTGAAVKQHALSLVGRTPAADTTAQVAAGGGFRGSGTMASAMVACVIAGGGAVTYCTENGLPGPVRDLVGASTEQKQQPKTTDTGIEAPAPSDTDSHRADGTQGHDDGNPSRDQSTKPEPTKHEQAVQSQQKEFGFEGGGGDVGGGSSSATDSSEPTSSGEFAPGPSPSTTSKSNSPAPASGGSEFGP